LSLQQLHTCSKIIDETDKKMATQTIKKNIQNILNILSNFQQQKTLQIST
jgi:hypothetical protein